MRNTAYSLGMRNPNTSLGVAALLLLATAAATPLPAIAKGAALARPAILFTNIVAGPTSGGPDNLGVPISIFGKGFGASQGTSTVSINGVEVARYVSWGENNANNPLLDMIVVQPGASVSAGPIVVTVGGRVSNNDAMFAPSGGAVYFVAPTGSDSAACSQAQPCATILHAAGDVMRPGDALLVRGGAVNDDEIWIRDVLGHSGTLASPKLILNYPGEQPIFTKVNRPVILEANHITFSGFRFPGGKSLGMGSESNFGNRAVNNIFEGAIDFDALGSHGNDHVIAGNTCDVATSSQGTQGHCYYISAGSHLRLLYNTARGAPGYGIHIFDQNRATNDIQRVIADVRVEGNLLAASPERSGLIIAMEDEGGRGNYIDGIVIRNNLFVANNFAGIAIGGIVRNVRIDHNTFYQNGRQGVTIYDDARVNGITVTNNLIDQSTNSNCAANCSWYEPMHIQRGAKSLNVSASNNVYAPGPALLTGITDSAAKPGAAGFGGAPNDLHLTSASAAIDAGVAQNPAPLDFDGQLRTVGAAPDAGAYEFGAGAAVPPTATSTVNPNLRKRAFVPALLKP